ncbi:hypothetical protein BVX99_02060 [bacterium F16]|nr:hypothetical protein BVX99_02060 [bacterium F16]
MEKIDNTQILNWPKIRNDLDILIIELPMRYVPMMPAGMGYIDKALNQCDDISHQCVDFNILLYHWSWQRFEEQGKKPGNHTPGELWTPGGVAFWEEDETINFFADTLSLIAESILLAAPKILGCSVTLSNYRMTRKLLEIVKQASPDIQVVFGGLGCSSPREAPRLFPDFDYMCIREGEITLPYLIRSLKSGTPVTNAPGIISKSDTKTFSLDEIPIQMDLDQTGFPKYEFSGDIDIYRTHEGYFEVPIVDSRGCVWSKCRFCKECFKYRSRSADSILEEIKWYHKRGIKRFTFSSSDFNGNQEAVVELCQRVANESLDVDIHGFQLRISKKSNQQFFELLKKSGMNYIRFGVDGWTDKILKIENKGYNMKLVERNLRDAFLAGLTVSTNILTGLPGESDEDVELALMNFGRLRCHVSRVDFLNSLMLFAGSEFYNNPAKYGITFSIPEDDVFSTYFSTIPAHLWFCKEPMTEEKDRLKRLIMIFTALSDSHVQLGPDVSLQANMALKRLEEIDCRRANVHLMEIDINGWRLVSRNEQLFIVHDTIPLSELKYMTDEMIVCLLQIGAIISVTTPEEATLTSQRATFFLMTNFEPINGFSVYSILGKLIAVKTHNAISPEDILLPQTLAFLEERNSLFSAETYEELKSVIEGQKKSSPLTRCLLPSQQSYFPFRLELERQRSSNACSKSGSILIILGSSRWANNQALSACSRYNGNVLICSEQVNADQAGENAILYESQTTPALVTDALVERQQTKFDCVIALYDAQLGTCEWEKLAHSVTSRMIAVFPSGDVRTYEGEALDRIQYNFAYLRSMFKYTGSILGKRTLEVGCSDGLTTDILAIEGAILATGIDIREDVGSAANRNNTIFHKVNNEQLPFDMDSFDLVYSIATMEHVAKPEEMFQEILRVTRDQGLIYVQAGPLYYSPYGHHMLGFFDDYPWIHLRMTIDEIVEYCGEHSLTKMIETHSGQALRTYIEGMLNQEHINGLAYNAYCIEDVFQNRGELLLNRKSYEPEALLTPEILDELTGIDSEQLTIHGFEFAMRVFKDSTMPPTSLLAQVILAAEEHNWKRIAIYGSGKFPRQLLPQLGIAPFTPVVIIDDNPTFEFLRGIPVQSPSLKALTHCDAILVASDAFEQRMLENINNWDWNALPAYAFCSGRIIESDINK